MFKCFWGHKYRLLSRCNIYYDHKNRRVSEDSLCQEKICTCFLYQCDRCQKFKEVELKGQYPEIPIDDLINSDL